MELLLNPYKLFYFFLLNFADKNMFFIYKIMNDVELAPIAHWNVPSDNTPRRFSFEGWQEDGGWKWIALWH